MGRTKLTIVFDDQGQVTKIMVGEIDFDTMVELPVKVGDPNSTAKNYDFSVQMKNNAGTVNVKVVFDSDTEGTCGNAYVDILVPTPIKIIKVLL